jgi:glycosyltransferase involved in cell wall biosynthesis
MRVLMMTDWNPGPGGAEAYASLLRDGLRAAGDEVCLLTSDAGTAGDGTADYVARSAKSLATRVFLQVANPFAAAVVRRAVRRFRPDVVWLNLFEHHLSPAAPLAAGGLPKVLMVLDYKPICPIGSKLWPDGSHCGVPAGRVCLRSGCLNLPHWLRDQPRYALIRAAVRGAARVLTCSRWLRGELAAAGISSEVLRLPVSPVSREFARAPASQPSFLFCGRLVVAKGADLLIRAFARLLVEIPSARLRLAGEGPERGRLEALSSKLGIASQVEFLGWRLPRELEALLSEAWTSVVPSRWAEPQGLVATEAIVRRVPVLASSAGGLGEVVEHGVSGLLFPNGDEAALLDRLRQIASRSLFPDGSLPEEVARRAALEFDLERHVARVRSIFAETIAGAGRRTGCRTNPRES